MAKPVKSQWDFGELFSPESVRRVLTVTELTGNVRRLLERHVGQVWVTGEVTNLRAQSSGHIYFTLKDAWAQLNCVLFRGEAQTQRNLLKDGQKVILQGEITVYEPRGQYQLRVMAVELHGVGALQLAFERLKQKLNAEGLFAPDRKRSLPRIPHRVGLVTSPTGAAIRDVLHVIKRRNPSLELFLAACRVQGQGAAEEIAAAIRLLNDWSADQVNRAGQLGGLDLIVVTRGGGSLEDLWAFNEELVARAIFESALPVVSAVGHEIDFTICDFVADARAATPSAAAEIITESAYASRLLIADASTRFSQLAALRLGREQQNLIQLCNRLDRAHPRRRLNEQWQRLDDLQSAFWHCVRYHWRDLRLCCQALFQRFSLVKPSQALLRRRQIVSDTERRLRELADYKLQAVKGRFSNASARLQLLSPTQVLNRGYSITTDAATGSVLRSADQTSPGKRLKTQLSSGHVLSVVEKENKSSS